MSLPKNISITVSASIHAPVEKVWSSFTLPEHITKWNFASDTWHAPHAENDLRVGGKFSCRMEAKDGSFGFDFGGVYNEIIINQLISYTLEDDRKVKIGFTSDGNTTTIEETFDTENDNSVELQRSGWQAILDNFKKHTESL